MQRTTLSGMIVSLLLFCCGGVLLGSDADELRERAKALQKKASISAEQGKPDQAERLERESADLLEAAERLDLKAKGSGEPDAGHGGELRAVKPQELPDREQVGPVERVCRPGAESEGGGGSIESGRRKLRIQISLAVGIIKNRAESQPLEAGPPFGEHLLGVVEPQ